MEKENSTEEEPVGFPAPKNVKVVDHNINVPTKNDLSDDEIVGATIITNEEHLEKMPLVHEEDHDIKPSTTVATHVLDHELDEEIKSSSKRHLVDAEMEDTSNDMEIRSQEDDNYSDKSTSSSSVRLSNSENSVNTLAAESDIKKEDQEKGNSVNGITLNSVVTGIKINGLEDENSTCNSSSSSIGHSNSGNLINILTGEPDVLKEDQENSNFANDMTVSCTATDIEIRTLEEDNSITNSSSPVQLSSPENSINALAHESDIQKENNEKGDIANDTILGYNAEGDILDHVKDKNDTGQSPETTTVDLQCAENVEMISKDVSHATSSTKDCGSSSFEDTKDMKTDPTDYTSGKNEESLVLYQTREPTLEAKTATWPRKASVLTKFVKLCAASNIFRRLSRGTDEHNGSNEKDDDNNNNNSNDSSKGDSQEVSHTTPEKPRWNLLSLSLIKNSHDKNQGNKTALEEVSLESPELKAIKGRIVLYTKLWCQDCKEARVFLRKRKLRYSEINIDMYPSRKVELEEITGSSDVPKVFFNQVLIGGLNDLKGLDESGQLEEKIEYVTSQGPSSKAPLPPFSGEDDVSSRGDVDELAVIVRKMKGSIVVKDRFYKFRRVTNCFLGSEAVDFLSEDQYLEREGAIEFARKLAKELFFQHVLEENTFEDGNHLYRFLDQDPVISQCQNIPRGIIQLKRQPLVELSRRLRFLLYAILDAYASEDGKHIAYRTIHGTEEFARYLRIAEELQRLDLNKTAKEERLAFFINLYNLMSIHAILVCGHPEGAMDRRKMFNDFKYVIGGCAYSLSDIQNGILRANQRPPYSLVKPFGISDKRFKVALPYSEPLIHFALVSGNRSAPALRCYSPKNIDRELMEAARGFLQSGAFALHLDSMTISVTKILKWFSVDFGKNEAEVLKHAANYLEVEKTQTILELLDSAQLKVVYQPYDWRLNS